MQPMEGKQGFTLIEILIAMVLIGSTLSVVVIKVPQAIEMERFQSSVKRVITKLTLAEEWMLNYRIDMEILFENKEGILHMHLRPLAILPTELKAQLNRYEALRGIESCTSTIRLYYDATIGKTPAGLLTLEGKNQKAYLTLKGYPASVVKGNYAVQAPHIPHP